MLRPANLLIYYGWLNSYESGECGWDNEKVAQSLAKYELLVFGDGVQDPAHGDFVNSEIIISRIKELNPETAIFGYVTVSQDMGDFRTKVRQWDSLEVHGIFMDEAGYDYGKSRLRFNKRVDFVHSRKTATLCFVNAWNIDHVLGTKNDLNYPNADFNGGHLDSNLNEDDWYLLESFSVNTDSYAGNGGYATREDVIARGEKAVLRRSEYGLNLAAVGIVANDSINAQALADFNYFSGLAYAIDAIGVSDSIYGAGSARSKFFQRPVHRDIDVTEEVPEVAVFGDHVLLKYIDQSRITVDFTPGSESSSIVQF